MSEGSLCPCTEPEGDDGHGSSTAVATWLCKGISTGDIAHETSVVLFPHRRSSQSPAEQTPLDFWVQPLHPQTPRAGFTSGHPQASGGQSTQGKLEA